VRRLNFIDILLTEIITILMALLRKTLRFFFPGLVYLWLYLTRHFLRAVLLKLSSTTHNFISFFGNFLAIHLVSLDFGSIFGVEGFVPEPISPSSSLDTRLEAYTRSQPCTTLVKFIHIFKI
jgi:hypothetical protein